MAVMGKSTISKQGEFPARLDCQNLTKPMGFPSRLHTLEEAPWTDWFSPWTCWGIQSSSWKKKLWVPTIFLCTCIYIYVLCTHYMVVTLCFFLHTFPWNNGLTSGTSPSRSEVSQQQTRLFCPKSGALWKLTRFETKQWLRRMIFIVDMAMKFCSNGLV